MTTIKKLLTAFLLVLSIGATAHAGALEEYITEALGDTGGVRWRVTSFVPTRASTYVTVVPDRPFRFAAVTLTIARDGKLAGVAVVYGQRRQPDDSLTRIR